MGHFARQYGLYRAPIWPILEAKTAYIATRWQSGGCEGGANWSVCEQKAGPRDVSRIPSFRAPTRNAPRITSGGGPARHALRMFGLLANGLKLLKLTRVRDKQTLRLSRGDLSCRDAKFCVWHCHLHPFLRHCPCETQNFASLHVADSRPEAYIPCRTNGNPYPELAYK